MVAVSYLPWWQGDTSPKWDIPLNNDNGPDDLIAANVNLSSFWLVFRTAQGVDTRGTGTVTVKLNNPAEILYQPSDADVAATFNGQIFVKALTNDSPART